MTNIQEKHHELIEHIKDKHDLSFKELTLLENLKTKTIESISLTTDGGFDCKTGVFYSEENKNLYKVRILYKNESSSKIRMVCLVSSSDFGK